MTLFDGMKTGLVWRETDMSATALRRQLSLPEVNDDPISGPLGDVPVASIARFHLLRRLLRSNEPAIACLAAGIIGAARHMWSAVCWRPLAPKDMGLVGMHLGFRSTEQSSWPSAVIKCAGAHLQMLANGRNYRSTANDIGRKESHTVYTFEWSCLSEYWASTISDDSGIRRNDVTNLREKGVLVKPTASVWIKVCQAMNKLAPNQFSLAAIPSCRCTYRQNNGKHRSQPLAPARTLAMLQYAADILPHAAVGVIAGTDWRSDVVHDIARFQQERERYAMWAAGNTADISLQVSMFDLLVTFLFDRMPGERGGARKYSMYEGLDTLMYDDFGVHNREDDSVHRFFMPPWHATPSPYTSCIDIAEGVGGIFDKACSP